MVKLWVVNTDYEWFSFLSQRGNLDEVNFWQPSGIDQGFKAVSAGELFVFRLKSPRNVIAGFGVFDRASILPVSIAWEWFGEKNGCANIFEMRTKISTFRNDANSKLDFKIGCRILTQPIFLPEALWIPQPRSWAPGIVVGKTFTTADSEGAEIWDALFERTPLASLAERQSSESGVQESGTRFGSPTLITPRRGQGAFRVAVTEAYEGACAISGGKVLPALEAAHIFPYSVGGRHDVQNGILFRKDIHSVFDAGYVTIDKDLRFVVSARVKEDFNNGNEYYRLHGSKLRVPAVALLRPDAAALDWHNRERFIG